MRPYLRQIQGWLGAGLILLATTQAQAQSCSTVKDGDFNDPTTFTCTAATSPPSLTFTGTININHVVNIPRGVTIKIDNPTRIYVSGGGKITIGTGGGSNGLDLNNAASSLSLATFDNDIRGGNNQSFLKLGTSSCNGPFQGNQNNQGNATRIFGPKTLTQSTGCAGGPLPVSLVSFTAKVIGPQVLLSWSTAWEQNAERFVMQRSADLGEFSAVSEVLAKGTTTTTQQYGTTDTNPQQGPNYYRLKQVDRDGSVNYSPVISAVVSRDAAGMIVYPNPTLASANLFHLQLFNAGKATFQLYTLTGQQIPGHVVRASGGEADFVADSPLARGLYVLEMSNGSTRQTVRVAVK